MPQNTNIFLSSLGHDAGQALKPHLSQVPLDQHAMIFDVREPVEKVHFPLDASFRSLCRSPPERSLKPRWLGVME
jgi:hypothetical protein